MREACTALSRDGTVVRVAARGLMATVDCRKPRDLTDEDFETFRRIAAGYVELAKPYREPPAKAAE